MERSVHRANRNCTLKGLSLVLTVIGAGVVTPSLNGQSGAWAQGLERRFAIRIGTVSLEEALREIQRATGVSIAFSPDQIGGHSVDRTVGYYTPFEAIERVLRGTGFILRRNKSQFLVVASHGARDVDVRTLQASRADTSAAAHVPRADLSTLEEIVITGSRLTTGFETATPMTTVTTDVLRTAVPTNIADALLRLPALGASVLGNTNSNGAASSVNGQSLMNFRNLGANRNLVLLNGKRMIATNTQNSVDINVLPQNLISRIDIVTAGASAAYGSDAVAGVLNFILDTGFIGLKGEVGGGISSRLDVPNVKASVAGGKLFANDRLHVIASASYVFQDGTRVGDFMDRPWWDVQKSLIPNTTGTGPLNLIVPNLKASNGSDGGLITNTVLRGTNFVGDNAVPMTFDYGFSPGTTFTSGGDGHSFAINFATTQWRTTEFIHAEYDISAKTTFYAEVGYSRAEVDDPSQLPIETGTRFQYTIFDTNPYIPAGTRAAMAANGITSFTMGRYLKEYEPMHIVSEVGVFRQLVGVRGEAFADGWTYDASYARARSRQLLSQTNMPISRNMYAAADAVTLPDGRIVCRSQYYSGDTFVPGGTGLDAGCRPLNLFGTNSVQKDLQPYTVGDAYKDLRLSQDVISATISGKLDDRFSFDAGSVSIAVGAEYRVEKARQTVNPLSTTLTDFTGIRGGPVALSGLLGPYRFFNPQPFSGNYNVKEAFLELGVPLIKDTVWARSFNTDMAVRYTDYSTSGGVTTWKVGANYEVTRGVRLRGTVSRDIRAPNLLELYNTAGQGSVNITYPSSAGGTTVPAVTFSSGNPNLVPERAITQTYGIVLTPRSLMGLQFSADYYSIKIDDGIGTVTNQQAVDNCFHNIPDFCSRVIFDVGALTIYQPFLNLKFIENAGIDFEASYEVEVFDNPLHVAALATHLTRSRSQAPGSSRLSTLGDTVNPRWRAVVQINYGIEDWNFFVQERFIAKNLMDATKEEGIYVDENDVPAAFYTDLTITRALEAFGTTSHVYLTVNNVFDKMPPISLLPPTSFNRPTNRNVYDPFGRFFHLGIRFQF